MIRSMLFETLSVDLILLVAVYKLGGETRVYDVALSTGLDPSTILYHLRIMERKKLVRLNGDKVSLTPKAMQSIEELKNMLCR